MTALQDSRKTAEKASPFSMIHNVPVAAGAKIFAGSIVNYKSDGAGTDGYGIAGVLATGQVCLGIAQETVDNTLGADGDLRVNVRQGIFKLAQTGTTIDPSDVKTAVYVADDQTVTLNSSGASQAGTVYGVDSDGVWVAIKPF